MLVYLFLGGAVLVGRFVDCLVVALGCLLSSGFRV